MTAMRGVPGDRPPGPAQSIRLAVIGGDGIGPEVVTEAVKVIRAAAADVAIETTSYDLGSQRWLRTGEILPASVLAEIAGHDAILLGAVGDPSVPSGVLERGLLLRLRFEFDQYVNLRPVRLYPGVASPLSGLRSQSVDMLVVREGTEGPYIEAGGVMRKGTPGEVATQESINTAFGIGRVTRYALQRAAARPRKKLTLVHKSNVLTYAGDLWRRTIDDLAKQFSDVTTDYCHMDAASIYFVTQPERFDVIVTDNMFGDILTALGAAVAGGIGLAASASINPERTAPSMFEPVHGSAPDIAGQQKADPTAAILSSAMLCEHIGLTAEAARIEQAVAEDLVDRQGEWAARTTLEIGDDIAERVGG
jgi:3-isopropylmalate dehydrogenase